MWPGFVKKALRRWGPKVDREQAGSVDWDSVNNTWKAIAQGETMTSIDAPFRVLQAVKLMYQDQPWFRDAGLDTDDAGVHVVVHAQRSTLPASPACVSVIDGVRVLLMVHG